MLKFFRTFPIGIAIVLATGLVDPALSDDTQSNGAISAEQSEGMKKLRAMSDYMKSAESMSFVVNSFFEEPLRGDGPAIKRFVSHKVYLQHPDKLAFRAEYDDGLVRVGNFDGKRLIIALPADKTYTTIPVSGSIDGMLDFLHDEFDISLPIADFLYSDFYAAQKDYIEHSEYVGSRRLFDRSYDQVVFTGPTANWQLWIGGDRPLPARFIATYFREPGDPEYMATFLNWTLNGVAEGDLLLEIPDTWRAIDLSTVE